MGEKTGPCLPQFNTSGCLNNTQTTLGFQNDAISVPVCGWPGASGDSAGEQAGPPPGAAAGVGRPSWGAQKCLPAPLSYLPAAPTPAGPGPSGPQELESICFQSCPSGAGAQRA